MFKRTLLVWVFALFVLVSDGAHCQKKGSTPGSGGGGGSSDQSSKGSGGKSADAGGNGGGKSDPGSFSIEAEIIAYKSLQSDSEAIACDVAAFLGVQANSAPGAGTAFEPFGQVGHPEANSKWGKLEDICASIKKNPPVAGKVLITSSADTTLANFQQWRVNMAIIQTLLIDSSTLLSRSCPVAIEHKPMEFNMFPGLESIISLDNISQGVGVLKDVLGLFAVNESISGVTGTIQDQALVDGVSRQLRSLNVNVLVPGLYSPFSLGGMDTSKSPFLSQYIELIKRRGRLQGALQAAKSRPNFIDLDALKKERDTDFNKLQNDLKLPEAERAKKQQEIADLRVSINKKDEQIKEGECVKANVPDLQSLISAIEALVSRLNGTSIKSDTQSSDKNVKPADGAPLGAAPRTDQSAPSDSSPLGAILAADGLVFRLAGECEKDKSETGLCKDYLAQIKGWRVLSLKALESGGSILTGGNLFTGTRVHYSGGAVATYALFELNGDLDCSGNVYDYGGYISPKKFRKEFRKPNINPDQQLIFFRGRCAVDQPKTKDLTKKDDKSKTDDKLEDVPPADLDQ